MPAILIGEPIVACLNNSQYNTPSEDEGEWVINDNISFDCPVSVESVTDSSLHMPLHKPSASDTPMKSIEGVVLVISPTKEGQLPIIFDKAQPEGLQPQIQVQTQTPHKFSIMRDQRTI